MNTMKQKLSRYTLVFEERNGVLLYNTASDGIMQMDAELLRVVRKYRDCPETLETVHPDLYAALCKDGFIVGADRDEAEELIRGWEKQLNGTDAFRLTVNPTLNCNLRCWYCYESHGGNLRMKEGVLERLKKLIRKQTAKEGLGLFTLDFFGGEPLLMLDEVVLPLLEEARQACDGASVKLNVSFTTNGVLLTEEVLKRLKEYETGPGSLSFQITLDGNREYHDDTRRQGNGTGTFDTIVKNISSAAAMGFPVVARCNYTCHNIGSFADLTDLFGKLTPEQKKCIQFDFHQVWQDPYSPDTEARLQEIRTLFDREGLSVVPENRLANGFCYADRRDSVVVNYDGKVYNCTAREFFPELSEGELNEEGEIVYNSRHERRMKLRYGGVACKQCKVYPICHGGCSQEKLETMAFDACIRHYSDERKTEIARGRLFRLLQIHEKKKGNSL